jgi:hypothetical protein
MRLFRIHGLRWRARGHFTIAAAVLLAAATGAATRALADDTATLQAWELAQKHLMGIFTSCSGSEFTEDPRMARLSIFEVRGLRLQRPSVAELTDIDHANGWEWRGQFGIVANMSRTYIAGDAPPWAAWQEGFAPQPGMGWAVVVEKRRGEWFAQFFPPTALRAINCATAMKAQGSAAHGG